MENNLQPMSRADYWRQHVHAWQQTGQSGTTFCHEQGLVYHQFVYWRQKLLKVETESTAAKPQTAGGFAHIRYQPEEASGLTVVLPNGIEIRGVHQGNIAAAQLLLASL
jgi:hypothetical protein